MTSERITIPYGVSYDGLLDVIGAWYRAQGYAKPMKTGDVGVHVRSGAKPESKAKLVSNQSSFLIQIRLLKRIGQSNQLTELGQEVSRLVDQGLNADFYRTMKQIILTWPQAKPLLDWIRDRGTVPKKELVEHIVQVSGKSMGTTNATMGANALIALFERVGLMRAEGSSFKMTEGVATSIEPVSPRRELVVAEVPKPLEEVVPEEKHEEAAPVVIELPGPVEEPIAEEKREEVVPVEFETPAPVEEAAPEEKPEEAEPAVSESAQPAEEVAPAEEHVEEEPAVTEAPQPVEEAVPEEKHEEAEPVVSEPPQPVEEAPREEKPAEKETVVSESREESEEKNLKETHNEPETVAREPSHATAAAAPTEKHEAAEAPRPTTERAGRARWKYCYSGCCCIFTLLLFLIVFGPTVISWLFP